MIKKNTIPTLVGVIILVVAAAMGVLFLSNTQIFKIGADSTVQPKNIRVANITDTTATISWTTDKETNDFLIWGASARQVNRTQNESLNGEKYFNHSITLSGLLGSTNYYYKISSNGVVHDNSNAPWQFTTGSPLATSNNSTIISGSVISATGNPEKKALVYADIGGYLLSTQTSDTGNFVFQIGSARTPDLKGYAQIDPASSLIQLSVHSGSGGVASAQIFPQSGNPVPPIIIGQNYDFRNEQINNFGDNPDASLNLPEDVTAVSKFNVEVPSETPRPTSVILESLTEGEIITSTQPQFFGKGPGGTEITITVHSDIEVNGNLEIPSSGSWSYALPSNLTPGSHTIKISWIDVSGITRFLTRNFVVQAGEVPAFTASQSGATATPSLTSTPTVSSSPSATPRQTTIPSPTSTALPVPVSGDLTPTLLLFMMGLVVMTFSFIVWKLSEN